MVASEIHYTHDALAAYDTHITMYAVSLTLIDGNEIVGFIDTILHHLGWNKPVIL